jgi:pyrophosphatase PpaX
MLWDIDGTLVDTTALIVAALDHTYRTFLGRTAPEPFLRGLIGTPLYEQIRVFGDPRAFGVDPDAMQAAFIDHYEQHKHEERIIDDAVRALVAGCDAGRPTALVTSKNRAEVANTLPRLGLDDRIRVIVTAEDVPRPKPHPDGVLRALSLLGASPDEAVFIGDTVYDLRAGRAAGVRCCAVTWGAATRDQLLAEDPALLCDSPVILTTVLRIDDNVC